jgi:hypothetical protein
MQLTLQNGYPYPYPLGAALDDALADAAAGKWLVLKGVAHFQWLHTVTVEFEDHAALLAAEQITGWERWGPLVLEAKTSSEDGYDHPAIVTHNTAYCGFMLLPDHD